MERFLLFFGGLLLVLSLVPFISARSSSTPARPPARNRLSARDRRRRRRWFRLVLAELGYTTRRWMPLLFLTGGLLVLYTALPAPRSADAGGSTSIDEDRSAPSAPVPVAITAGGDFSAAVPADTPLALVVRGEASPVVRWYVVAGALAVALLGAVLFWLGKDPVKIVGVVLTASSTGIVAIKSLDLLKFNFKLAIKPKLTIETGPPMRYLELPAIGPFVEGEDSVLADSVKDKFDVIRGSIDQLLGDRHTAFVFIVGGADKRQLNPGPRATYGSNEGLANARAVWIKSRLTNPDTIPILTWGGGAKEANRIPTQDQLAQARYVKVYVARTRK